MIGQAPSIPKSEHWYAVGGSLPITTIPSSGWQANLNRKNSSQKGTRAMINRERTPDGNSSMRFPCRGFKIMQVSIISIVVMFFVVSVIAVIMLVTLFAAVIARIIRR